MLILKVVFCSLVSYKKKKKQFVTFALKNVHFNILTKLC